MHLTTVYSEEGAVYKVVAMVEHSEILKYKRLPHSGYPNSNYSGRPHHLNAKKNFTTTKRIISPTLRKSTHE